MDSQCNHHAEEWLAGRVRIHMANNKPPQKGAFHQVLNEFLRRAEVSCRHEHQDLRMLFKLVLGDLHDWIAVINA